MENKLIINFSTKAINITIHNLYSNYDITNCILKAMDHSISCDILITSKNKLIEHLKMLTNELKGWSFGRKQI